MCQAKLPVYVIKCNLGAHRSDTALRCTLHKVWSLIFAILCLSVNYGIPTLTLTDHQLTINLLEKCCMIHKVWSLIFAILCLSVNYGIPTLILTDHQLTINLLEKCCMISTYMYISQLIFTVFHFHLYIHGHIKMYTFFTFCSSYKYTPLQFYNTQLLLFFV